ncbi:alpha/beta fold hydrolase [Lysobacter enzymogenes]|uniref:alpha/beta fold hydrolase n=1 Tax=Lysobacter enzymogenes TaxID=69 RepID=UPI0008977BAF|nr:alpha/beta fold hydrolase [Lysobacter enzymogenes]SDX84893.1 Lysophospholipase, alpha-beta hydrolase superfamily [Lysobacter enzymogenes]
MSAQPADRAYDSGRIHTHTQSDGYVSHYRQWGEQDAQDLIAILHGGISHSAWQAPLAQAAVAHAGVGFVALDRRGSGLNQPGRGHLPSAERELDDVASLLRALARPGRRLHLAGWCFGGQIATLAAERVAADRLLSSLVLIAPGFVFTERYADVLRLSMQAVAEVVEELGAPPQDRAFVPVPLQIADFTADPDWQRYVADDELRLRRVSQSTVKVWSELAERSRSGALAQIGELPVLAVFGRQDRLVDNDGVAAMLRAQLRGPRPDIVYLDAPHAIQFESPRRLAELVVGFLPRGRVALAASA